LWRSGDEFYAQGALYVKIRYFNIDEFVKSPNLDGFVKGSRSRLANPEE
jgi:hypothetical protein